jgi:hypothetical protein
LFACHAKEKMQPKLRTFPKRSAAAPPFEGANPYKAKVYVRAGGQSALAELADDLEVPMRRRNDQE